MDEFNISGKLRKARMKKGLSLKALAREVGCSISLLSLIENGKISPPIRTLSCIAEALDISLKNLFEDEKQHVVFEIIRNPSRHHEKALHQPECDSSTAPLPIPAAVRNKKMRPYLIRIPEGHPNFLKCLYSEESLVYVIRGKGCLHLGTHLIVLEEGDSVYFQADAPHGFSSGDDSEVLILEVGLAA